MSAQIIKPHLFQKGRSGNPSGKAVMPIEIRRAIAISKEKFLLTTKDFLLYTAAEAAARLADPKATNMERAVGAILEKAIEEGDCQRLEFLLSRLIGKAPVEVHIDDEKDRFQDMSLNELLDIVKSNLPEGK